MCHGQAAQLRVAGAAADGLADEESLGSGDGQRAEAEWCDGGEEMVGGEKTGVFLGNTIILLGTRFQTKSKIKESLKNVTKLNHTF